MTFTITPNRLNNDARRVIWEENSPVGMHTGFDVYFGDAKSENICALCADDNWWQENTIGYAPSPQVKNWVVDNYPELEEDMKCLAKFLFLTKNGAYHERADYVTRLWEERGNKLLQLVYLQYLPEFLTGVFPGMVSRDTLETIGIYWLSPGFPGNLPAGLARLADLGIDNDMQEFTSWLNSQYGIGWGIDEFLGLLARSFMDDLDFEEGPSENLDSYAGVKAKVAIFSPEVGR